MVQSPQPTTRFLHASSHVYIFSTGRNVRARYDPIVGARGSNARTDDDMEEEFATGGNAEGGAGEQQQDQDGSPGSAAATNALAAPASGGSGGEDDPVDAFLAKFEHVLALVGKQAQDELSAFRHAVHACVQSGPRDFTRLWGEANAAFDQLRKLVADGLTRERHQAGARLATALRHYNIIDLTNEDDSEGATACREISPSLQEQQQRKAELEREHEICIVRLWGEVNSRLFRQ